VIRTDQEADKIMTESKRGVNKRNDTIVKQNLKDQTNFSMR